jgi:hypothetical protein
MGVEDLGGLGYGNAKFNGKVIMINFVAMLGWGEGVWVSTSFWSFFVSNRKYMGEMRM